MIYQEYSDGQDTTLDYLAASAFTEYELTTHVCQMKTKVNMEVSHLLKEMKQWLGNDSDHLHFAQFVSHYTLELLFQSLLLPLQVHCTACLLMLVIKLSSTVNFIQENLIPVKIPWIRTISVLIANIFLYSWFLVGMLVMVCAV